MAILTDKDEQASFWPPTDDDRPLNREQLVRSSLHLVVAIAKTYTGRGLTLAALIDDGNVGLLCAAEDFDPAQDAPFVTYASWWIKRAIRQALRDAAQHPQLPRHQD